MNIETSGSKLSQAYRAGRDGKKCPRHLSTPTSAAHEQYKKGRAEFIRANTVKAESYSRGMSIEMPADLLKLALGKKRLCISEGSPGTTNVWVQVNRGRGTTGRQVPFDKLYKAIENLLKEYDEDED